MSGTAASPHFPCQSCQVRDKAICSALDDSELRELNEIVTSVELEAGAPVFFEGDDSTYLFNVVAGSVRLLKLLPDGRRQITGFLVPGDFLGLSIADVYAYTAEAQSDVVLCRFKRSELLRLVERYPKLEHRLLSLASNELAQAQEHLLLLGRKTAMERIITVLLMLAERMGRKDDGGVVVDLPMGRGELADYIGLTIETVSRNISRLRKEGVIDTPDDRLICIHDAEAFASRSGNY